MSATTESVTETVSKRLESTMLDATWPLAVWRMHACNSVTHVWWRKAMNMNSASLLPASIGSLFTRVSACVSCTVSLATYTPAQLASACYHRASYLGSPWAAGCLRLNLTSLAVELLQLQQKLLSTVWLRRSYEGLAWHATPKPMD